jgi:hypothetical protein
MPEIVLPVPAFNLILALVHLRGSGTTADFKAAFKFDKVDPKARKLLLEHELIVTGKTGNSIQYELTDPGWRVARQLLRESLPAKASPLTARILWAILGDFSSHLDRTGGALADLYLALSEPATDSSSVETVAQTGTAASIQVAYKEIVGDKNVWVPLRRLREQLDAVPREELDEALAELLEAQEIHLIPESNQKMLTPADRDAAIWLGGEYLHLLSIEPR